MRLTVELLTALIDNIRAEAWRLGREKRRSIRVALRSRIALYPVGADGRRRRGAQPLEAWTRDVSACGLSFISRRPLELHRAWEIELVRLGSTVTLSATVRRNHALAEGLYLVGMEFEKGALDQLRHAEPANAMAGRSA
jgi:hypothetical protein